MKYSLNSSCKCNFGCRFERQAGINSTAIKQDWSPEQISGRLFKEQGIPISHESIYLHIYQDKYQGGNLHKHLRCQKKRRKRYGMQDRRGRIPNRVSIDERPSVVNNKSRIGDWEGDTIIGKGYQGVVATLVERKTQYMVLAKSKTKQAGSVFAKPFHGMPDSSLPGHRSIEPRQV